MLRRLVVLVTAGALAFAGGCILGPKQDDPSPDQLADQDSGIGGGFDSSGGDAAPGSCADDGTHAHETGPGFDACPAPMDGASDTSSMDTSPKDTAWSDTIVDDAPSDVHDAGPGDTGETGDDTLVDDAATGD